VRWGCWYVKWGYLWGCEGFEFFRVLRSRSSGVARHASHFLYSLRSPYGAPFRRRSKKRCVCVKKSNQKKAHNLTKIDPEITYSLWGGFIRHTIAAPTKTFFTRLNWSSISELASSQYHSDYADFSKHNAGATNKFSKPLFILGQVKTVPNGRFLLLSSACRSKKIREEKRAERRSSKEQSFTLKNYWAWCGFEGERVRVKQRVMNKRTTISLKAKLARKAWCKCNTKKYPLYRLAIIYLKLLDRKHYEMHPSWSSFAVKVAAFFGDFLLL